MTDVQLQELLEKFRSGESSATEIIDRLKGAPFADLGFAQVDLHRAIRKGFPEVIFAAGKTPEQVVRIAAELLKVNGTALITRVTEPQIKLLARKFPKAKIYQAARCVVLEKTPLPKRPGVIGVLCAGTSDLPVAEEAAITAETMGNHVERLYDVGVAGLHRLLSRLEFLRKARVLVVVAGMEGALPSVVAGLVASPVIAVPTSIGYGANFGGLAALLGMLNSCGSGVTVVNIDNGFGAGYAASQINALACNRCESEPTTTTSPTRKSKRSESK